MELMLKDIKVSEYNKILNTTYGAEADIIVPDTKPDIHRVLCVNAVADLTEHYIRKGKVVFSGEVKFNIMYVGDNDKNSIYTIDYTIPFNHQTEIIGAEDDYNCVAMCKISSTEFKIKNSRKLMAKGNLNLNAHVTKNSMQRALETVDGDDTIPYRKKSFVSEDLVNSKNFSFSVSDTLTLPVEASETKIFDLSAHINAEEIKTVNNKSIIKGNIPLKIFYLADTGPKVYETEVSFTEIIDLDMAGPDSIVASHFTVCDVSYDASMDENELSVDVDIKINGILEAYETSEYSLVSDIYSPDYRYNVGMINSNIEKYTRLPSCRITVKDIVGSKNADGDISEIHYMNVYPSWERTSYEKSNLIVHGNLQSVVIYSDSNGEMGSIQKNIPYDVEIGAVNSFNDSVFDISVATINYGYVLSSDSDVQVRCVLNFEVGAYTKSEAAIITDFEIDKNCPIDKSGQSGIVVCYPDGKMSLWDYAVKYNTTCKEIALVNNFDEESELPKNVPLIISKRQIC